jgi:Ca-activated chloride channel homolog
VLAVCTFLTAATLFSQTPSQSPPPIPGSTPNLPPPPGQSAPSNNRIRSEVDLVVLRATVVGKDGNFVPGLNRDNFRVFEDKVEQRLTVFHQEDTPVTVGLVIDNSGSMREKRAQVNAAALRLVESSNPQDEVFVVNFNDDFYLDLDKDFTSDPKELKQALERIDSRGGTAFYDALVGSLDHLRKGHKDKKVLLVITDGEDQDSTKTFEYALHAAQQSSAVIYAIGVYGEEDRKNDRVRMKAAKRNLKTLADATGGAAYFPNSLTDLAEICSEIARDIRNQYTLGYNPTNVAQDGSFRSVQVQVVPPRNSGKLTVRTRSGYYAPRISNSSSGN